MSQINQKCVKCGNEDAEIYFSPKNEVVSFDGNVFSVHRMLTAEKEKSCS